MMRQSSDPYIRVRDGDLVLTTFPVRRLCNRLSDLSSGGICRY